MPRVSREEMVAAVLLPYFDAVRDVFAVFCPAPGLTLDKVQKVRFVVDPKIHDKPRHFAATTEDGLRMFLAPQLADLDEEVTVAIITHEFGHAVDFLYPWRWITPPDGPGKAVWVTDPLDSRGRQWRKLWQGRNADQIEWAADGIAHAVTGRAIGYKGACVVQSFSGGIERPVGLR